MAKIIVKNAVKRKEGYLYSIDSEGNLVETKQIGFEPAHAPMAQLHKGSPLAAYNPQEHNSDEEEEKVRSGALTRNNNLSNDDNIKRGAPISKVSIDILSSGIRSQTLKRLLNILLKEQACPSKLGIKDMQHTLKVSERTAYDYVKTIAAIKEINYPHQIQTNYPIKRN